jgi:hypothetical protein
MRTYEPVNPYASPASAEPTAADFRQAAVEESQRLVRESGGLAPQRLGVSLCLPIENPATDTMRRAKWGVILRAVAGILGLIAGGVLAAAYEKLAIVRQWPPELIMSLAAALMAVGLLLMLSNPLLVRRLVQRSLGERYDDALVPGGTLRPKVVGVEDSTTFHNVKAIPEDLSCAFFDEAGGLLRIEGILYRYFIRAADVILVEEVRGVTATGVRIVFRIGRATLAITLQHESLLHELRRQTIGAKHDPLWAPISRTLRVGQVP